MVNDIDPSLLTANTATPVRTPPADADDLSTLKQRVSLLDVANSLGLNIKQGMNVCPFHDDKNPSLSVDTKQNLWKCFGCQRGGSQLDLIIAKEGGDNKHAVKRFYEIAGVPLGRHRKAQEATTAQEAIATTRTEKAIERVKGKVRSMSDALKEELPPIQWRIQHLLTQKGVLIIASPPKQFKTFLAIHAAQAVSTGTPLLENFKTEAATVLYVDEENGERTLLRRFKQIADGHHLDVPSNLYYVSFALLKLDTPEGANALDYLITTLKPGLVVLDSMVRFLDGDEDKASDVRRVFETLKAMLDKHDTSFLILHHTRKGNGNKKIELDDLRGSSDFGAFADAILNLTPKDNGFEFRILANRHVGLQEVKPQYIEVISDRQQGPIRFSNHGVEKSRKGQAIAALMDWIRTKRLTDFRTGQALAYLEEREISKQAYYEAIAVLLEEGTVAENKPGYYRVNDGVVVTEEEVK